MCINFLWTTKIEDLHANLEDSALIFEEIEDSIMCRELLS